MTIDALNEMIAELRRLIDKMQNNVDDLTARIEAVEGWVGLKATEPDDR